MCSTELLLDDDVYIKDSEAEFEGIVIVVALTVRSRSHRLGSRAQALGLRKVRENYVIQYTEVF
jgi:hypothetical protein